MYKISRLHLLNLARNYENRCQLYNLYAFMFDPLGFTDCAKSNNNIECLYEDMEFLGQYDKLVNLFKYFVYINDYPESELKEKIKVNDQLTLVHDFYKSLNPEIYNLFLKHFNHVKDHLHLYKYRPLSSYEGQAHLCQNADEYFITMKKRNNLDFSRVYVHECGHIVGLLLNNDTNSWNENTLFDEIESQFMELIYMDYLLDFDNLRNDANTLKIDTISTVKEDSIYILRKNTIINEANKLLSKKFEIYPEEEKEFFYNLCRNSYIEPSIFNNLLEYPIEYTFKYTFSFLYALGLYNIYKQDKEKSLYLFKKCCQNNTYDTYKRMDELKKQGLNPASSINLFTRSLKR